MRMRKVLNDFRSEVDECVKLLALSQMVDSQGHLIAASKQREQMIVAAYLNFFLAWECLVENAFLEYMLGCSSITGNKPLCRANPTDRAQALNMLVGTQKYFDFSNQELVLKMAGVFFERGEPFRTHLLASTQTLADLRTMRNASAHLTTTTQTSLDSLCRRVLGPNAATPCSLPIFLLQQHPQEKLGVNIFSHYQLKLDVVAELICRG